MTTGGPNVGIQMRPLFKKWLFSKLAFIFIFLIYFVEVSLISDVVFTSALERSASVMYTCLCVCVYVYIHVYTHRHTLFHILFHCGLPQDIEV